MMSDGMPGDHGPSPSLAGYLSRSDPHIEVAALLIARDEYPDLDVTRVLCDLDALAEPLVEGPRSVTALLDHVRGTLGFAGNADDYYDPRNSFLNDVVARRTGIPITLATVLIALGRRIGLDVVGVGFPGHFLVRAGGVGGALADPFAGRLVARAELAALASRFLGGEASLRAEHLRPVPASAMAVRMLLNLRGAFERRGDHGRAARACGRLFELTDDAAYRRDRGVHALALGSQGSAAEDLAAYLAAYPDAQDAERVRRVIDGFGRQRAVLN